MAYLLGKTVYCQGARREQAPKLTNCFSAIYYIFKKSTWIDVPLTWIGDMPRVFFSSSQWRLLYIEREEAKYGDVLFVGKKEGDVLISHVALILGVDRIFHSSLGLGTAAIQTDKEFFSRYEQRFSFKEMIQYTDNRSRE